MALAAAWSAAAWAAGPADPARIDRLLDQPLTFSADGVPAREMARRLGQVRQVPIFLDRRLDPGRPVSLLLRDRPLREGLEQMAEQLGAETSQLSTAVYIGPIQTARGLATQVARIAASVRRLPSATAARWLARGPLHWEEPAVPAQILQQLEAELGRPIDARRHVVHDLWPAVHIDGLTLLERVALVLVGFDASLQIHPDGSATSIDFPSNPTIERTYRVTAEQYRRIRTTQSSFPESQMAYRAGTLRVVGRLEHHRAIERLRSGAPRPARRSPGLEPRYELRIQQQTLAAVLDYLESALDLEFQIPDELQSQLGQRVSLEVNQMTADELLEALLEPAGIRFDRQGRKVRLHAP